jgi:hypothetical protein
VYFRVRPVMLVMRECVGRIDIVGEEVWLIEGEISKFLIGDVFEYVT